VQVEGADLLISNFSFCIIKVGKIAVEKYFCKPFLKEWSLQRC
jgi:hypothetical protein